MKILPIISREYRMIVKKKSFLISTLLTPALMAGFIFLPMLFSRMARAEKTICVVDYSGTIAAPLIGGLVSSTVMVLFVIPVLFFWVRSWQHRADVKAEDPAADK